VGGVNCSFNREGPDESVGHGLRFTIRGKLRRSTTAASVTGTYVVCLDCGREFPYDWSQMKMLASKSRTSWAAKPATVVSGLKVA
jgi:hypothetical protein